MRIRACITPCPATSRSGTSPGTSSGQRRRTAGNIAANVLRCLLPARMRVHLVLSITWLMQPHFGILA